MVHANDPLRKDIDRPLGLAPEPRRPVRFGAGSAGLAVMAVAVLVASSLIALRPSPFRDPPPVVATAPVEAVSQPTALAPAATGPLGEGGPAIIKVSPPQPGQSQIVISDPSAVGQNLRVAHLPERDLIEEGDHGMLPVRAADGRRPFDVYARPWSGARGARVAIVIGGIGVSQTGSQRALDRLPPEVTIAFATGGNSLDRWMQTARRAGHEIVLQLPLEPFDYPNVDPGRGTLTVDADKEETLDNLRWALGRITNYTGVMNYMGARFVADQQGMDLLMAELGRRGLMYVDDGSSARSLAEPLSRQKLVPYAVADTPIDAVREPGAIMKKLDELERVARAKGSAVGIGSAFDVTVDAVARWANEAKMRGVEIVPISALAADPGRG